MFNWKEAGYRGLRTFFQTLAGTLGSIQVAEMATGRDVGTLAVQIVLVVSIPLQAGLIAFFMNLGGAAEPAETTPSGESV